MELVRNIEKTMREWYRGLPHLPTNISKWIAQNAWWLVIIGLVVGAISVLSTLSILGIGTAYVALYAPVLGAALAATWVWLLIIVVALVIQAMAVTPLKAMQRRGWELLFLAFLITASGGAASELLQGDVAGLLGSLLGLAIGAYVLFEIDRYFGNKTKY